MSNVASKELCEELYELSGWKDTERVWYDVRLSDHQTGDWRDGNPRLKALTPEQVVNNNWDTSNREGALHGDTASITEWIAPAYDLGYLLRKLQVNGHTVFLDCGDWNPPSKDQLWQISWDGNVVTNEDTPEDAAATLAIELLKSGVLTSEHSTSQGASTK